LKVKRSLMARWCGARNTWSDPEWWKWRVGR
jgi:hypothetical protein